MCDGTRAGTYLRNGLLRFGSVDAEASLEELESMQRRTKELRQSVTLVFRHLFFPAFH
jgi:hypothetical protein